jgi:hypothetical protein
MQNYRLLAMETLLIVALWLIQKSAEIILSIILNKVLKEKNFQRLTILFKKQILVLYLNWTLRSLPSKSLPSAVVDDV